LGAHANIQGKIGIQAELKSPEASASPLPCQAESAVFAQLAMSAVLLVLVELAEFVVFAFLAAFAFCVEFVR
jgi:hypothetical protein